MMKTVEQLALALGLALAMGCGDDGDDGDGGGGSAGQAGEPGEVDTGLPEDRPIQDISAEEYANACESLRQSVRERMGPDRAVRGVCEVYAGALLDEPAQCRSGADTCVTQVNAGNSPIPNLSRETLDFTMFECGDVGGLQGCTVTVGELETCLEDRMTTIEGALDANGCDNAASVTLPIALAALDQASTPPQSCAGVQACPGLAALAGPAAP